jgi:hypothetical protein
MEEGEACAPPSFSFMATPGTIKKSGSKLEMGMR